MGKITNYFSSLGKQVDIVEIDDNYKDDTNWEERPTLIDLALYNSSLSNYESPTRSHPFFIPRRKKFRQNSKLSKSASSWPITPPLYPNFVQVHEPIFTFNRDSYNLKKREATSIYSSQFVGSPLHPLLTTHSANCPFLTIKSKFSQDCFNLAISAIKSWIEPSEEEEKDIWYSPKKCQSLIKRSIAYLWGTSNIGKSYIAHHLATELQIPLKEICSASLIKNPKQFDDIFVGDHDQRSMMSNFIKGRIEKKKSQSKLCNDLIKMIVLVDAVDIVYPQDKFYGPLNSFLKSCPSSILCILTSNANPLLLKKFIEFPSGTLFHMMSEERDKSLISEDSFRFNDEDCFYQNEWEYFNDYSLPTCCINYEFFGIEPYAPSLDPLLKPLQRECLFMSCSNQNWVLFYRHIWIELEMYALHHGISKGRRTTRKGRIFSYLEGVPEEISIWLRNSLLSSGMNFQKLSESLKSFG